jgi:hypothetical protein|tara:strand:+ start:14634 stop:15047 length:414 start_codon:yes stop_codon:yes gene_type:complete
MGLEGMGSGLKTRLETISDLARVYAPNELPNSINEFPVALVLPGETLYNQTFGNAEIVTFRILIMLSKQDTPTVLNRMLDYIEKAGSDSVYAAIDGDATLGGEADFAMLISNSGAGTTVWGGHQYLSTEFLVEAQKA